MSKRLLAVLILIALAASAAYGARRRKSTQAASAAPGDFDFYILSLSWAPDFCDLNDPNRSARECGTGNHVGFIVHGLWPQKESGPVERCAPARPVAQDIVTRMLPLMMDPGLIQHEWANHGTCSGLSPAAYFDLVRKTYSEIQIPAEFKNLNREIQVSPQDLDGKFAAANPGFPREAFHAECKGDEVSEERICLTKDLAGRACSIGECRVPSVRMLPLR